MPPARTRLSVPSRHARRAGVGLLSVMALGSACARFGFERLDPDDGGGLGGRSGLGGSEGGRGGDGGASGDGGVGGSVGGSVAGGGDAAGEAGTAGDVPGGAGQGGAPPDGGSGEPVASCSDDLRNGDELGVDCGGACVPCNCSLGVPERLGDPNYAGNDLWSPRLSGDGLILFFAVTVPGAGEQVAYALRPDRTSPFGLGNPLPPPINQGTEGTPHPSLDNQRLYFYSERAGGAGARDLYVATRGVGGGTAPFADVSVAPLASLNGPSLDYLPWLSPTS
jgi:WD40 repeat protein